MKHMHASQICCSVDKKGLAFPSFSVVFIHTFMLDGDIAVEELKDEIAKNLNDSLKEMKSALRNEPKNDDVPISSLVEYITRGEQKKKSHFVKMPSDVEELLFPAATLERKQISRYSLRGFDFCLPVRSAKEKDKFGEYVLDFPSLDFVGHANVDVSQFFGNIFSVTYRFLFDGHTCKILVGGDDQLVEGRFPFRFDTADRETMDATTNHLISLLSSCLGAEYWSDDNEEDDEDDEENNGNENCENDDDQAPEINVGIDLKNRLAIKKIWLDWTGVPVERDANDIIVDLQQSEEDKWWKKLRKKEQEEVKDDTPDDEKETKGTCVWPIESNDRVFDKVLLRYKKFIAKTFCKDVNLEDKLENMTVADDSRYAMVDIWETLKHPYGSSDTRDLFSDTHWPKLSEAEIINHIRDYHKPELVGLMSMYPAEWPYRAAEAYDEVCGENIAIDTDDLVLAGSHMTVVIGTYGRRGDGESGVNWKKVMRGRRFYHVSWEEYLLIVQFVLAKKYTFNHAVDTLLALTDDMSDVTKATIGECSAQALLASKKAIELDVIKHMKFPSHKVMYDRTRQRLGLDTDFQRFKDVQEVVTSNLQSLGEFHAAEADSFMNKLLIAISVMSLLELAFQQSEWPFVSKVFACDTKFWDRVASMFSGAAAVVVFGVAIYGIFYGLRKLYRKKKK